MDALTQTPLTGLSYEIHRQTPINWIADLREATYQLPGYDEETVRKLLYLDRGKAGSNMTTRGLAHAVTNGKIYEIAGEGLKSSNQLYPIDMESKASNLSYVQVPPFLEIAAQWNEQHSASGEGNNILGDNGRLYLDKTRIEIPVVEATDSTLAYYGATLIQPEEAVRFPDEVYPLFRMHVGEDYLKDFIMTEEGEGMYLEYHTDQPHFHLPLQGGGQYLLAKWNEDATKLRLTAFHIPDGHAVYTKKGAIHCDAALFGELIVGYTISKECSTVLLTSQQDSTRVEIQFIQ